MGPPRPRLIFSRRAGTRAGTSNQRRPRTDLGRPSTSVFQMGTIRLTSSITHSHAANVSTRWLPAHAMATESPPTGTRPRRWKMDIAAVRGNDGLVHREQHGAAMVREPWVLRDDAVDEFPEGDAVAGGPREAARSDDLPVGREETQADLHPTFRWSAGPKAFALRREGT